MLNRDEEGSAQRVVPYLSHGTFARLEIWLRGRDLNPRPLGYEPNELPDCSTPRYQTGIPSLAQCERTGCHFDRQLCDTCSILVLGPGTNRANC